MNDILKRAKAVIADLCGPAEFECRMTIEGNMTYAIFDLHTIVGVDALSLAAVATIHGFEEVWITATRASVLTVSLGNRTTP